MPHSNSSTDSDAARDRGTSSEAGDMPEAFRQLIESGDREIDAGAFVEEQQFLMDAGRLGKGN